MYIYTIYSDHRSYILWGSFGLHQLSWNNPLSVPFSLSVFSFLNNELDISNMFLFSVQLNPKFPRKQYFLFPCSFIVCNQGAWWWNLINVFGRKWVWQVSALCVWKYPFPLFCAGEVLADAFEWWGWQLRLFFKVQCYSKIFFNWQEIVVRCQLNRCLLWISPCDLHGYTSFFLFCGSLSSHLSFHSCRCIELSCSLLLPSPLLLFFCLLFT